MWPAPEIAPCSRECRYSFGAHRDLVGQPGEVDAGAPAVRGRKSHNSQTMSPKRGPLWAAPSVSGRATRTRRRRPRRPGAAGSPGIGHAQGLYRLPQQQPEHLHRERVSQGVRVDPAATRSRRSVGWPAGNTDCHVERANGRPHHPAPTPMAPPGARRRRASAEPSPPSRASSMTTSHARPPTSGRAGRRHEPAAHPAAGHGPLGAAAGHQVVTRDVTVLVQIPQRAPVDDDRAALPRLSPQPTTAHHRAREPPTAAAARSPAGSPHHPAASR